MLILLAGVVHDLWRARPEAVESQGSRASEIPTTWSGRTLLVRGWEVKCSDEGLGHPV